MFARNIRLLTLIAGFIFSSAFAQIPIPVRYDDEWLSKWSIRERNVDMMIRDQVASVTVTDNIYNPCSRNVEVQYIFPLPPDAAVDQFTLVVDGRELTGEMMNAEEARRIYDDIVRRQKDPGLLEYAGYGFFRSSAFPLGPGKPAQLVVHYTATCKKDGDVVEVWYPMSSGRLCSEPVGHFSIRADIQSLDKIANVFSPSLELDIEHKSPNRVVSSFEATGYRPLEDFQLFYEELRDEVGATFLTYWPDRNQDGYYLMMVSPDPNIEASAVIAKDILIVLDRSGSMSGEKIQQAREAVRFILQNLNRGDNFNFISYNDNVSSCFDELLPASNENIERATDYLDRVDANGGTNIYQALESALMQFKSGWFEKKRPAYLIFLTDGLPTVGNKSETAILENASRVNQAKACIFAFGVGYDVNVRLLDNLVNQNHGRSTYVKQNESIETKVSALYTRIKNPYMTNVSASLEKFGTRDDCPSALGDLFENDQLIQVGRIYPLSSTALDDFDDSDCSSTLKISGMLSGAKRTFEYLIKLNLEVQSSSTRFIEKLWATRRIGELLSEVQLHGRTEEVVDELIRLSKKYGIVTPYTSFLADENQDFAAHEEIREQAVIHLKESAETISGPQAQMDAVMRSEIANSPGFKTDPDGGLHFRGARSLDAYESSGIIGDVIETIRVVGNVTLYKKGDVWMTSETADINPVDERSRFIVIQKYSDEYFILIDSNTSEENKVLASQQSNEKLAIELRGIAYLIE